MEENELRKLIEDGFKKFEDGFKRVDERFNAVDERFNAVDERFNAVDERFNAVDERFNAVDEQFATIRREFSEQLDGLSDGLHAETRALKQLIVKEANAARAAAEALDSKIGLLGENVGNVRTQLAQYHHRFEAPLEARVTKLEAHAWAFEQKKDETEAESRRRS